MHIPGCQKNGAFHIGIQKIWAIHILSVEKRGPIIYLAALKRGAIRHAHPYYAKYRKLGSYHPPPPPPTSAGHSAKKCRRFSGSLLQSLHFYFHQLFTNFTDQIKFCSVLTWSDLSFSRDFVGMVTRIASKMEGRKKDKHQQQHQQHEDKDKCDNRLKCWLGKHGELVDFSDVAPSPCKDFYHVFVTPQEVSLIIAS